MAMLFAVVLLSIPAVLLACSTLPPGQEARVGFMVEGLNSLPIQFATSVDQTQWAQKYSGFAPNAAEALKNLQKSVKKALMQVIKEEAKRAGLEHLAADIARQIKPTVRYTPMNCDQATGGQQVNPPKIFCTIANNAITNVEYNNVKAEIPANYREFTVNLLISNYVIAGWGRERWELTLMKVERQLRKDKTYGPSFKTATITLLYP